MKNPGSVSARQRLAQISHHFLSEEGGARAPQDAALKVALGATAVGLAYPLACGLARALALRGHAALVVDDGADLHSVSCYTPTAGRAPAGPAAGRHCRGADPEICLVPLAGPAVGQRTTWDRLLMAVDVSREGMRHAYLQLKELYMHDKDVPIGATMLGAGNAEAARRSFGMLATAAYRFLDLRILSYGWLSAAAARGVAGGDAPEQHVARGEVLCIADLLLADTRAARDGAGAAETPAAAHADGETGRPR